MSAKSLQGLHDATGTVARGDVLSVTIVGAHKQAAAAGATAVGLTGVLQQAAARLEPYRQQAVDVAWPHVQPAVQAAAPYVQQVSPLQMATPASTETRADAVPGSACSACCSR